LREAPSYDISRFDALSRQTGTFVTSTRRSVDIPTRAAVADAISAGGRCGPRAINVIAHDMPVDTVRGLSPSHWAAASLVVAFSSLPSYAIVTHGSTPSPAAVIPEGGASRRGPHGNLQTLSSRLHALQQFGCVFPPRTHARSAPGNPLFSLRTCIHWAFRPIKSLE
jgi:hypothetical protein